MSTAVAEFVDASFGKVGYTDSADEIPIPYYENIPLR